MIAETAIDAHVHLWTSDVASYPLATGYAYPADQPKSFTAEEFLELALPHGVERAVLIQSDFYGYDNSFMLDAIRRFPNRFAGVAQVSEFSDNPAGKLRRLESVGVRGLRVMPLHAGDMTWLQPPGMHSLWRCAAERRLPICPLIDAPDLVAVAQMCRIYPDTPVVIDHAANIGCDGEVRESNVKMLCEMAQFPSTYVKVSGFYYLGTRRPPYLELAPLIRCLLKAFGSKRLMWGSDCPFQLKPPNTYSASLELIRDRLEFLNAEDKEWLLRRTTEKVFFPD